MAWKTNFSNGGDRDRAILDKFYLFPGLAGNIFYVFSGAAGTGDGLSPLNACTTINAAVALCAADNHDTVIVLPGHSEAMTAAGSAAISVAGVTVLGLGTGRQRGKITYTTAAAASFDVTAARVTVRNLTFVGTGVASVTAMVNVKTAAADCTIDGCEFEHANATNQAVLGILTDATADRLRVTNCRFHGTTDAGTTAAISLVGGNDISIDNNVIQGAYTASGGAIAGATTDSLRMFIGYNYIVNGTASATKVIVLTASSTGIIADNIFSILSGTAPVTAAALNVIGGNYYKAAAGVAAGTLV